MGEHNEEEAGRPAGDLTVAEITAAEKVIGLAFTADERAQMLAGLSGLAGRLAALRAYRLGNEVAPAFTFRPDLPGTATPPALAVTAAPNGTAPVTPPERPANLESLAFASLAELGALLRAGQVTSVELTEMYLARLERHDRRLYCVIELTADRALAQARAADAELAAGHDRGPLHGIPWGAKDLLAVRGTRTTWGAAPYQDQVIDLDATVVQKLDAAGAVLAAKLTTGALAYGDQWFGERTRNPWDLDQGSNGSSAGPASAAAAGLVGFTIGSETYGSIVSPATRCGASGLRPTFGRVSRHGAMALCWSLDKLGPIARSAADCALVFAAIHGADGLDDSVVNRPFAWPAQINWSRLRIGYVKSFFDEERDGKAYDDASLDQLRALGAELVPIELPAFPLDSLLIIINAEAAAAFDELTRSNRDDLLVRQADDAWPNIFRQGQFIPAVAYINANRVRTAIMQAMAAVLHTVDLYLAPSFSSNLWLTNLTGHPAVVVPNGFGGDPAKPVSSLTFTGRLYDETTILAVAAAYQQATNFHNRMPPHFRPEE